MKKVFIFLFLITSCFILNNTVYAGAVANGPISGGGVSGRKLTNKDYTLECIYDDGTMFSYEYSQGKNSFQQNKTTYKVLGASSEEATSKGYAFVNTVAQGYTNTNSVLTCAKTVYSVLYDELAFYKFGEKFTTCTNTSCPDLEGSDGWCIFGFCVGDLETAKEAQKHEKSAKLVSERYILNYDYKEPNATFYYTLPAVQAAGVNAYIKFLVYDNAVLLEKDDRVTEICNTSGNDICNKFKNAAAKGIIPFSQIYINSPEPIIVTSSDSSISYYFKATKYTTSVSSRSNFTKYTYTDNPPTGDEVSDAFCTEKLKNTSPILRTIIKYSQIIIPAIVLIITGIDMGKIVVSGNLEEELPKRKKLIITRLIVMATFFFLPLFVSLFITLIKTSGIGENNSISNAIEYIDCLFT